MLWGDEKSRQKASGLDYSNWIHHIPSQLGLNKLFCKSLYFHVFAADIYLSSVHSRGQFYRCSS